MPLAGPGPGLPGVTGSNSNSKFHCQARGTPAWHAHNIAATQANPRALLPGPRQGSAKRAQRTSSTSKRSASLAGW
jgi:hypothetical protein